MSVIDWGNSVDTILVWRIDRSWQVKSFEPELAEIESVIDEQSKDVCLIIDIRQCLLPVSFSHVLTMRLRHKLSPNITTLVIIAADEVHDVIVLPRGLSHHCEFHIVNSVDEAYALAEPYNETGHEAFV